jgi:hypothetical protein
MPNVDRLAFAAGEWGGLFGWLCWLCLLCLFVMFIIDTLIHDDIHTTRQT